MSGHKSGGFGRRLDLQPIAFAFDFLDGGAFRNDAEDAVILAGTAAQLQLLRHDGFAVRIDEPGMNPDRRGGGQRDAGPFGRLIRFGFLERHLLEHVHAVASLESHHHFAVDRRLPAHVDVVLLHDSGTGRNTGPGGRGSFAALVASGGFLGVSGGFFGSAGGFFLFLRLGRGGDLVSGNDRRRVGRGPRLLIGKKFGCKEAGGQCHGQKHPKFHFHMSGSRDLISGSVNARHLPIGSSPSRIGPILIRCSRLTSSPSAANSRRISRCLPWANSSSTTLWVLLARSSRAFSAFRFSPPSLTPAVNLCRTGGATLPATVTS